MTDLPHFGYVFKKPKIVNSTHSCLSPGMISEKPNGQI